MKIIEKLKKLIRHEQSARTIGNLGEAENFAARIQELLDAYNLSLSDIDVNEYKSSVNRSEDGQHAINSWQKFFIIDLAKLNGCECIFTGTRSRRSVGIERNEQFCQIAIQRLAQTPLVFKS
jgi:sugar phosphate isomerase/epimerase